MTAGRISGLGAGDVEPDGTPVAEFHGQLGDLPRSRGVPHRGDQGAHLDALTCGTGLPLPVCEPGQHGVHDVVKSEAGVDVQLRRKADLGVHHAIGGEVFDAFGGHAMQRGRRLHDTHRVRESLQILLQRATVGGGPEP